MISNIDDKRQVTGTYTEGRVSTISAYIPGENSCLSYKACEIHRWISCHQTENHWSNETVHLAHLTKTIIPHIEKVRKKLNLKEDQKAFLMYHVFKGQTTDAVSELLEKNNIILKKVPANKTDPFQPLINKSLINR